MKYIWMAVTPDKYELPIAVEDSARKLADLLGVSESTVKGSEFRHTDGHICGVKYVKVRNTDEDTDTDCD